MKKENTNYCTTFSIKRDIVIDRVKHHNLSDKPMIRIQVYKTNAWDENSLPLQNMLF